VAGERDWQLGHLELRTSHVFAVTSHFARFCSYFAPRTILPILRTFWPLTLALNQPPVQHPGMSFSGNNPGKNPFDQMGNVVDVSRHARAIGKGLLTVFAIGLGLIAITSGRVYRAARGTRAGQTLR
jgi:hypothetical protein